MKYTRTHRAVLLVLLVSAGCAHATPERLSSQPSAEGSVASFPESRSALALDITFAQEDVPAQLKEIGLWRDFSDFWQAHVDRDWNRRYAMELGLGGITNRFYAMYYANAWPLKAIKIHSVQSGVVGGQPVAILRITMTHQNPDNGELVQINRIERWRKTDQGWRHMLDDPMLTGNFARLPNDLSDTQGDDAVVRKQQTGANNGSPAK